MALTKLYGNLLDYYLSAKNMCITQGYSKEIDLVEARRFKQTTDIMFLQQYVYVVLNAGMKNQVAEKIFKRFIESGMDIKVIGHEGKRKAIAQALEKHCMWFKRLKEITDKLGFIETLPWMGPVTKYHLARNIGIDVAKPDRHLLRIAERFKFNDVQEMCKIISKSTGDRLGTVDVILWRASNLGMVSY